MSYVLDWSEAALNSAAGFLSDDPAGLDQLIDALDGLVGNPFPGNSAALGEGGLRRLKVNRYRALYEVVQPATISVIHVGRTG